MQFSTDSNTIIQDFQYYIAINVFSHVHCFEILPQVWEIGCFARCNNCWMQRRWHTFFFSFQILFANHKYDAEIDRVSAKGNKTCVESNMLLLFSKVICHSFLVVKNLRYMYMFIILSVFHSSSQSNEVKLYMNNSAFCVIVWWAEPIKCFFILYPVQFLPLNTCFLRTPRHLLIYQPILYLWLILPFVFNAESSMFPSR